jgi:hypothetical protein
VLFCSERLDELRLPLGGCADSPGRAGERTGAGLVGELDLLAGELGEYLLAPRCNDSKAIFADCSSCDNDLCGVGCCEDECCCLSRQSNPGRATASPFGDNEIDSVT